MNKVFQEVGKHFLSIGLAVIAFVLIRFGIEGNISLKTAIVGFSMWLLFLTLGAILIFMGGRSDG
ncbi:hypothetical protein [Hydrogenivirga sp. 128-5-R1-1]|uniref:hypothetical protein n=1 Tax=Hydrogenivirga sp. 128-5-R1-1 TaxID=392423 RepID=UPI00015F3643|nr:hypothetical protein [Hydrogenivirga sp. 128-5-R1-1]EDP76407.1 hypothetical protein HG1285_02333 [Hydrogenivirga sp. 128-5-R1-1]